MVYGKSQKRCLDRQQQASELVIPAQLPAQLEQTCEELNLDLGSYFVRVLIIPAPYFLPLLLQMFMYFTFLLVPCHHIAFFQTDTRKEEFIFFLKKEVKIVSFIINFEH